MSLVGVKMPPSYQFLDASLTALYGGRQTFKSFQVTGPFIFVSGHDKQT